jgi:hypothetical protein
MTAADAMYTASYHSRAASEGEGPAKEASTFIG